MASFGAVSAAAQDDQESHSGFSSLKIDTSTDTIQPTRPNATVETPSMVASIENNLSSITEGAVASPVQPSSPTVASSSSKPVRRPSMMAKLLDFGRKKSFLDRDSHDSRAASPAPSHGDELVEPRSGQNAPGAHGHRNSFRSGLRQQFGDGTPSNEEALDLEEDEDDGAARAQMMRNTQGRTPSQSRRRSSAGSSGRKPSSSQGSSPRFAPCSGRWFARSHHGDVALQCWDLLF